MGLGQQTIISTYAPGKEGTRGVAACLLLEKIVLFALFIYNKMYFKLLPYNACVYKSANALHDQLKCVHSVSARNLSVKKFPSALAFAVYRNNQKDNIRCTHPPWFIVGF